MIAFLLVAALQQQVAQRPEVLYEISFSNAVHHEANIVVTYKGLAPRPLELRMSRSSPGRYALHEFAKNVYNVVVTDTTGRPLTVTRPNEHQWNVMGHTGHARISYTLYGDHADGTYTGIDRSHAHLNMPATFMFARQTFDRPVRIRFNMPEGSNWRVATQLVPTTDSLVFTAPNLQYFFDSPTELSNHVVHTWAVPNRGRSETIRFAVHHQGTERETNAFVDNIKKIVLEQQAIFGELPAFDYRTYTFIADYLPWVFGDGMEHRNSTIVSSSGSITISANRLLGTISHEFFHAWNVERIRPRALEPFDFERANMSGELWFAEGFTSYYGPLAIKRAGITSLDDYAAGIGGNVNTVLTHPGRLYFSPIEMSMHAPFVDAAASIDATNRQNTFISYYTYGAAIALGLDLALRTEKESSLDDFMRAMWARYGKTEMPYTLDNWRLTLGQVVRDQEWANEFFNQHIAGKEPIDFETLLGRAGLLLRKAATGTAALGNVGFARDTGRVVLETGTQVGSALYEAGVDRGDRIVSLDGRAMRTPTDVTEVLTAHKPDDQIEVVFESRGESRTATLTLQEREQLEVVTYEKAGMQVTPELVTVRESWLSSKVK